VQRAGAKAFLFAVPLTLVLLECSYALVLAARMKHAQRYQSGIPDELPPDHERREWLAVARELTKAKEEN
jgi:hypothetical protein